MGKVEKKKKTKKRSIKWSFLIYLPICAVLVYMGAYGIGIGTNQMQSWYMREYLEQDYETGAYEIITDEEGNIHYSFISAHEPPSWREDIVYWIISWAQAILIPAWVLLCVGVTGTIFYRREMKKPITILLDASQKISDNCLDFQMEQPVKNNELGELCQSFENMRSALYQNNQEMWRMLEERKRLNAAFSHDMRTPITVLRGYADLLELYIPNGKISEEKLMEILEMMSGQINRLESYTRKMSEIHRLEDVTAKPQAVLWKDFVNKCQGISDMLVGDLRAEYCFLPEIEQSKSKQIQIDEELVLEVYENLVSNAVRYAKSKIDISVILQEDTLQITISDDGNGFTEETLRRASDPFFREEQENEKTHFGLGLYISKLMCEKCRGELLIENGENGGRVIAKFKTDSR